MGDSLYRAIFDNSPVALLLADDARRYIGANAAACRLLGLTHAQLLRLRIDDVVAVPEGDVASVERAWADFLRDGQQSAELMLIGADGERRTVSFSAQAHVQPGVHLSVLLDVSAQKERERGILAEREALYAEARRGKERVTSLQTVTAALTRARTLDEVAQVIVNEGCTAFDAQRGVVAVAIEAGTMIELVGVGGGGDRDATVGQRFSFADRTPMIEAIRSLRPQMYETGSALEASFPELYARFWMPYNALVALPLALPDRQPLGAMALAYLQPRCFVEEEQQALLAFARVCAQAIERARLFDLAQTERRRAEEANRAKDEFLALVSHELQTPLHALLGWTALARSGRLAADALERALHTVERNAQALAKLVEDLLDITRISSGKMRLNIAPTWPSPVIEAALEIVRPAAEAKGVLLVSALAEVRRPIAGDPDRLQQIVWNLLSNAVKFTERGGSVRVGLGEHGAAAEIVVEDTGRGIEPSLLPHIFERFRQTETSTRGRLGLGIGLAIVRHLVELHGGTIDASSQGLGMGARFVVSLPFSLE